MTDLAARPQRRTGPGLPIRLRSRQPSLHATRLLHAHIALAVVAMAGAALTGRPEVLALSGPSFLLCVLALLNIPSDGLDVKASFDRDRGVEGDIAFLRVETIGTRLQLVDVDVVIPDALRGCDGTRRIAEAGRVRPLGGGQRRHVTEFEIELATWGITSPDKIVVRTSDWLGLLIRRHEFDCGCRLQIHLPDPKTRSLIEPARFLGVVGNHLSGGFGDGCELADVRPYRPGDRLRDLNWRISARSDEPWITQRHPDRAATVVIVVDLQADVGVGDLTAYRRSARLAIALAQSHLRVNDEVGLALIGQRQRWLDPRSGRVQAQRITDVMLEINSDAPRGPSIRLTSRVPRDALVVFITKLETNNDLHEVDALMARGNQVSIVDPEVATVSVADWDEAQKSLRPDWMILNGFVDDAARTRVTAARLAAIDRARHHRSLVGRGLRVVDWRVDEPVESVVLALHAWRQARALSGRS